MQENNFTQPLLTDYPATRGSDLFTTAAPDLQNNRDIAPIVVALQANNAIPLLCEAERNPLQAGELGIEAEFFHAWRLGGGYGKK